MQKFRNYIYCDEDKMSSYISQISELSKIPTSSSYEKTTEVAGGIDFKVTKADTNLNEKKCTNYILNSLPIENFVNWSCNANNAINYNGKKIKMDDKDKLIILNGTMTIPEISENMEILNSFTKNSELFNMISLSDDDKKKMNLIKESDNVPILLETDSRYIFSGNLKKASLIGKKDDFFDNLGDEITIIGRIDKIYDSCENVEIYDLAKEVLKLNRAIRKKLPKEILNQTIIWEEGPLVKITPIIIYK